MSMTLLAILAGSAAAVAVAAAAHRARRPEADTAVLAAASAATPSWIRPAPVPVFRDAPIPQQLGPYELQLQIGEGAMSRVFRARDTRTGTLVALKVPHLDISPEHLEAFDRELEITRELSHPNLVAVLESGYSQEYFYVALELVDGNTLESLLFHGPLQPQECWEVARQLSSVLYFAHRRGLIHGDVKPANIMVTKQGNLKMLDFGIGGEISQEAAGGDSVFGTPEYLAPEVLQTGQRSPLSDQYAAGVVLYELLTGRLPASGLLHQYSASGRLAQPWRQRLPSGWLELTGRMLQRDPAQRYADLGEIHELLLRSRAQFLP